VTCAVVLRHSRGIVLGADSALSCADDMLTRGPKIVRRGKVWLACAGGSEEIELLLDGLPTSGPGPKYLAPWLQRRLRKGVSGVAICDHTFQIVEWDGRSVCEVGDYTAIGSGSWPALGALHALRSVLKSSPAAAVLGALRASAAHTTTVGGPFDLVSFGPNREPRTSRHR
jgi:ATP-dependent protease HslVU (ClpYQ) peptidase subunit